MYPRSGERREDCHRQEEEGGGEHAPAYHQGRSVFFNDAHRFHCIDGTGQSREKAPEKGFFRNGETFEVTAHGNEGRAGYSEEGAEELPHPGPPFF